MNKTNTYAVIRIKGRQYIAEEGKEILIDRNTEKEIKPEVLLMVEGEKVTVGKPTLEKSKVILKVLGEEKGEKIDVLKYKAKSRYRKHTGFRAKYTKVLVEKIS